MAQEDHAVLYAVGRRMMTDNPRGRYEGRDVVIDFDAKKIRVRRVTGWLFWKREEWLEVSPQSMGLNTWWTGSLRVGFERYSIADLPLTLEQISRGLGVVRLDSECAERIWEDPHSVKGDNVAIDFSSRELVTFYSTGPQSRPTLVKPFSALRGVVDSDPPRIIIYDASYRQEEMRGLPLTASTLAERLGVELVKDG
jgi:hypothetical protein